MFVIKQSEMFRPYLTKSTKQLIAIAHAHSGSVAELKVIVAELSERKNDYAFRALFEVGQLLEKAQAEEARREIENRQRAETQRLLRRSLEDYFEWPSTDAPASIYGLTGDVFFYQDGLLSYVGYRVGQQGVENQVRKQILDCVFHNELPQVVSPAYMNEWGIPRTAGRLQKLAETLAAFTRNAKRRRDSDLSIAIAHWELDLDYLYHQYYVGNFGFAWPYSIEFE